MRQVADKQTGEILNAVVITDLDRFRRAQQRLVVQSRPARRTTRTRYRSQSSARWWLKLISHLTPIIAFGAIAIALLLNN